MICAIHQPNFFPWAGYFNKMRIADIFIFLDEVDYPKSGSGAGSWCNRVKLWSNNEPAWFGLPIRRTHGSQLIKEVEFSNKDYHVGKLLKSLEHNYKKYPGYPIYFEIIHQLMTYQTDNLSEFNIHAITTIAKLIGINTKLVRQSELNHQSASTALLIELIQAVNADTYLCGNGASGYQDDILFEQQGITLKYQQYNPLMDKEIQVPNEIEGSLSILNHILKGMIKQSRNDET